MFKFSRLKFLRSLDFLQDSTILTNHYPVMYREVIEKIQQFKKQQSKSTLNILDCTIGTGGHSKLLIENIQNIDILGLDMDERMIQNLPQNINAKQDNFINFNKYKPKDGRKYFDIIFADLGYNINQVYNEEYGLSYKNNSILDMRYSKQLKITAADILNQKSQQELREIFSLYGNIYNSHILSQKIIQYRQIKQINTANQLIEILNELQMSDQIMKTFQALRIIVNQEIQNLNLFLEKIFEQQITSDQLILIITFHSLEADIVQKFALMNKKYIKIKIDKPKDIEIEENPRSRSAKLFELIYKSH